MLYVYETHTTTDTNSFQLYMVCINAENKVNSNTMPALKEKNFDWWKMYDEIGNEYAMLDQSILFFTMNFIMCIHLHK